VKILTDHQYDDAWWAARRGMPTASAAKRILTPGGKPSGSKDGGQSSYIDELIGDQYDTGYPRTNDYQSPAMRNGSERESEAIAFYSFAKGIELHQVGLCCDESGRYGFSPDSLCGTPGEWEGVVEAKNPLPKTHIKYLRGGVLPDEYKPQVHFTLVASGLEWVDFISYATGLPELIVRVTPDKYTGDMRDQMEVFWDQYQTALQLIRDMSPPTDFIQKQEDKAYAEIF